MQRRPPTLQIRPTHLAPYVALALLGAACSGGGGGSDSKSFVVQNTRVATSATSPVRISGDRIAFLAAEDTTGTSGADLNGDGFLDDGVAHVVNTATGSEFQLGVAAEDLVWVGDELYLVVDEAADGHDWDGDVLTDRTVLLHWSEAAAALTFVDALGGGARPALSVSGRLVYESADDPAAPFESDLRLVESAAPTTPVPVPTTDAAGPLEVEILGADEGLVFLALDETSALRDLNGDTDTLDEHVLALLDGTVGIGSVQSVGLAVDDSSPFRAKNVAASDWRVAFLVDEHDQGGLSRNSAAVGLNFRPAQCGTDDTDDGDQVLCCLRYGAWSAGMSDPVNHGLPGGDRIALVGAYVATIVDEQDDGPCDLNDDGDTSDHVVRWVQISEDAMTSPILPVNDPDDVHALFDAPGGSHGLAELGDRFLIVISESDDGDLDANNALDSNLVAWLQPSPSATTWSFQTAGGPVAASWLEGRAHDNRLGLALEESLDGQTLNPGTPQSPGDSDILDSIPTFATFSGASLSLPGVLVAVDRDAAGITVARNAGLYRVSEAEDSRSWNGDADETDYVALATNLSTGVTLGLSVVTTGPGPVVVTAAEGDVRCGALIAPESAQGTGGTDFDGDTDKTDLVLRWFRF